MTTAQCSGLPALESEARTWIKQTEAVHNVSGIEYAELESNFRQLISISTKTINSSFLKREQIVKVFPFIFRYLDVGSVSDLKFDNLILPSHSFFQTPSLDNLFKYLPGFPHWIFMVRFSI